ncbi:MAG: hypothetical protein MI810_07350 [Flavobacteriales bacterium]|nr:hypothetical protein [Flavobacteriales bacterium]
MNTYNDNLRSSVVDSLNEQELEQKKMEASMNASKFTLYYAQEATITDAEKLDEAEQDSDKKAAVKKGAVTNSNNSINVLTSAKQQKQFSDLSVSNAAVSAANVQIATNAVVKLASDMGSISSIINAADYGTDIYDLCKTTKHYMDITASHAEVTSQYAMESSALMSEVSSANVEAQATVANTSIQDLLKIATSEYDAANEQVTADNEALAVASAKEKVAEGNLEDANTDYYAANSAYTLMNSELNMSLTTANVTFPVNTVEGELKFQISFDALLSPFPKVTKTSLGIEKIDYTYPVQEYAVFIVKSNKSGIFNIATAENIFNVDTDPSTVATTKRLISVPNDGKDSYEIDADVSEYTTLRDTDNERIEFGKSYVVFVFAKYLESYKSEINNFENFLSASSPIFTLTSELGGPIASNITVESEEEDLSMVTEFDVIEIDVSNGTKKFEIRKEREEDLNKKFLRQTMQFKLNESVNKGQDVEYRCMFIPANSDITANLLTEKELNSIEKADEMVQKVFEAYSSTILSIQAEMVEVKAEIHKCLADGDTAKANELKNKYQELSAKLKETEASMNKDIARIKQMKITSNFDTFEQMVDELKIVSQDDLGQFETDSLATIDKYLVYKIQTDALNAFKTDLQAQVTNKKGVFNKQGEVAAKQTEIKQKQNEISGFNNEVSTIEEALKNPNLTDSEKTKLEAVLSELKDSLKQSKKDLKDLKAEEKVLSQEAENALNSFEEGLSGLSGSAVLIDKEFGKQLGTLSFFFDLDIAEQVSTANYTVADIIDAEARGADKTWQVTIESNTTDNFGNLLVEDAYYIPVVLTYSTANEEDLAQFTNKLSDIDSTAKFKYQTVISPES